MTAQPQADRPGNASKLVKAGVLLVVATLLGALALNWEITPVTREGESTKYLVTPVMFLVAIVFSWWAGATLVAVESKRLSTKVVVTALALGLVPYVVLLGSTGYVFNTAFILAALSSVIALWRFPDDEHK